MSSDRGFVRRTAAGVLAASALYLGSVAAIATASAHVEASSADAVRGGVALVSFQVPDESTTGAATTTLTVDLTGVSAVRIEAKAGWSAKLDRVGSGAVRSVTWTAAPNGGIEVDQFGVFRISAKLPDADAVSFPATQTYADGAVVKWDQPSLPGQAEPEHPAPTLAVGGGTGSAARHDSPAAPAQPTVSATPAGHGRPGADNTARGLAGAALLLGAVGVGAALVVRRT
jgi:uncharacterized protein YcnI